MPVQTVAVIGAGPAGRVFALRCAAAGLDVVLEDVMPSNLRRAQDDYAALGISGAVRYASTVEEAVRDADIAIDFVPDELESKLEIFSMIDRMAPPKTILCTPTHALSITDLASCTYRAGLCVGLRSEGVTLLDGAITVLRSRFADPAMLDAIVGFLARLGMAAAVADDVEEPMLVKNLVPLRNFDLA